MWNNWYPRVHDCGWEGCANNGKLLYGPNPNDEQGGPGGGIPDLILDQEQLNDGALG